MKTICTLLTLVLGLTSNLTLAADELVKARDGSGVYGYRDTPKQPWSGYLVHDPDRPIPKKVETSPAPDKALPPPSDAIVLFDGKNLDAWNAADAKIVDGCIEMRAGEVATKERFGNCQIHLEWMAPKGFEGPWYNRGNSGVSLMGVYEIQVFDSWNEKIYADGMAGALYGQTPPLVNACRPPGEWQSFDIVFTAPKFEGDKLVSPARVTMLHNGVLAHLEQEIYGNAVHRSLPQYTLKASEAPLTLSGHNCPVRFRNIWIRRLPEKK
jgi:hypothetical protein